MCRHNYFERDLSRAHKSTHNISKTQSTSAKPTRITTAGTNSAVSSMRVGGVDGGLHDGQPVHLREVEDDEGRAPAAEVRDDEADEEGRTAMST